MKAFILAAGKGERMLPLTKNCPKPLLRVGGKTLLDFHIERLIDAGVNEIIINTAYLSDQIEAHLSEANYSAKIILSKESEPLETGGALYHAQNELGSDPIILINADVWFEIKLKPLLERVKQMAHLNVAGGHLVLVKNPTHNPRGDFSLKGQWLDYRDVSPEKSYTFSGLSILSPTLIRNYPNKRRKFPLLEVFLWALSLRCLSGELSYDYWLDVGTPERLETLKSRV